MGKVATVERIINVRPHPNADKLDLIDILGWQVVSQKGQGHAPGNLVVYINIDSIVNPHPQFAFLEKSNFRIKPIRLRGEMSNGLILPLSVLEEFDPSFDLKSVAEGMDISNIIGARHYEKQLDAKIAGIAKSNFPSFICKTDEDNARNEKAALEEVLQLRLPLYITQKIDGSSGTFYYDFETKSFGVCSRALDLKEDDQNAFWVIAKKYNIEESLKNLFFFFPEESQGKLKVFIQGEVYGPKMNGNQLGETELKFACFTVGYNYTNDKQSVNYFGFDDAMKFCAVNDVPSVPIVEYEGTCDLTSLIELANSQVYPNGKPAEGIVVRTKAPFYSRRLRKFFSLKVMNENYKD